MSCAPVCHLADKYGELYDDLDPPLNKDVIVAGAVLHDIGKLRELAVGSAGADYTAEGCLIGHVLQGRDIVREAAAGRKIDPETLLRLEHVIVSHQRLPEWGCPKPDDARSIDRALRRRSRRQAAHDGSREEEMKRRLPYNCKPTSISISSAAECSRHPAAGIARARCAKQR